MIANQKIDLTQRQIGDYRIIKELRRQIASTLYLAQSIHDDETVYLLCLRSSRDEDTELTTRFQRRIETVAEITHANIAATLDSGISTGERVYVVIAYTPGITLAEKLATSPADEPVMPVQEALLFVRQVAEVLKAAHLAGIIHHDLRPENIILRQDGSPILIDLSLPVVSVPPDGTANRVTKLDYQSPEQRDGKPLSESSNVYSLGILLYRLLAGHQPQLPVSEWDIFESKGLPREVPLEQVRSDLTLQTYQLVQKCLWQKAWSRFETMAELIAAIDAATAAEEINSQPLRRISLLWHENRRWIYVLTTGFMVLLVALLFLPGLLSRHRNASLEPKETAVLSETRAIEPSASSATPGEATPTTAGFQTQTTTIQVLGPLPDSEFKDNDDVAFSWIWPHQLEENQAFYLFLWQDGESTLIGSTEKPVTGFQYRLRVKAHEISKQSGTYEWQVTLAKAQSNTPLATSTLRSITLVLREASPTPTIRSTNTTATPTSKPVASPSASASDTAEPATTDLPPTAIATATPPDICVPSPPIGWVRYTVQANDVLSTLAQQTGTTVARIQQVNCLDGNIISIGQTLWLPSMPVAPPTTTPTPLPTSAPPSGGGSQPTKPAATSVPPTFTPPPPP